MDNIQHPSDSEDQILFFRVLVYELWTHRHTIYQTFHVGKINSSVYLYNSLLTESFLVIYLLPVDIDTG
jgi:hypothetical protein